MTSFLSWLYKRILFAFIILVLAQLVVYAFGLKFILSNYEKRQFKPFQTIAIKIIENPKKVQPEKMRHTGPFFVFSENKKLLFSNKGKGRPFSDIKPIPLYKHKKLIGYYYVGGLRFIDNKTNKLFLTSIIILCVLSIFISALISIIFSVLGSKKMSTTINKINSDIHDITKSKIIPAKKFEIKELSDISNEVSKASRVLVEQEEYKQQWLVDISHDIRTPLAGLKSQIEAMIDGILEPNTERLKNQLAEINRLENLAKSVSDMTSIENTEKIEKQSIDGNHLVASLITPFEAELKLKQIELKTQIAPNTKIYANKKLLLRALGNIISNAVKYIDPNGSINITAISDDKSSTIEISNDGPDIPKEQQSLIFTRLYRGDSSRNSTGSGIGLAITKEIILRHSGSVEVKQLNPRGVIFTVKLPRKYRHFAISSG